MMMAVVGEHTLPSVGQQQGTAKTDTEDTHVEGGSDEAATSVVAAATAASASVPSATATTTSATRENKGVDTFQVSIDNVDLQNITGNRTLLATVSSKGMTLEVRIFLFVNFIHFHQSSIHPSHLLCFFTTCTFLFLVGRV